jgi:hypothetical protein
MNKIEINLLQSGESAMLSTIKVPITELHYNAYASGIGQAEFEQGFGEALFLGLGAHVACNAQLDGFICRFRKRVIDNELETYDFFILLYFEYETEPAVFAFHCQETLTAHVGRAIEYAIIKQRTI